MSVRAKFMVGQKLETAIGFTVNLYPVSSGSVENEDFYKYTPTGQIELTTINKAAADQFVVGGYYYVDFFLAEE